MRTTETIRRRLLDLGFTSSSVVNSRGTMFMWPPLEKKVTAKIQYRSSVVEMITVVGDQWKTVGEVSFCDEDFEGEVKKLSDRIRNLVRLDEL